VAAVLQPLAQARGGARRAVGRGDAAKVEAELQRLGAQAG